MKSTLFESIRPEGKKTQRSSLFVFREILRLSTPCLGVLLATQVAVGRSVAEWMRICRAHQLGMACSDCSTDVLLCSIEGLRPSLDPTRDLGVRPSETGPGSLCFIRCVCFTWISNLSRNDLPLAPVTPVYREGPSVGVSPQGAPFSKS